jgi:selT/selW/selH-like putative selenoprotein
MEPELVPGSNGIFDITVDDKTVFSKSEARRFPDPGEVVKGIKWRTE